MASSGSKPNCGCSPQVRTSSASSSSMPSAAEGSGRLGIWPAARRAPGRPRPDRPAPRPVPPCSWRSCSISARARRAPLGRLLLRGAQRLRALGMRPPAGVGGQQRVEVLRRAAPGQRGPVNVGILPCSFEVNHGRESSRRDRGPAAQLPPVPGRIRPGMQGWAGPVRPGRRWLVRDPAAPSRAALSRAASSRAGLAVAAAAAGAGRTGWPAPSHPGSARRRRHGEVSRSPSSQTPPSTTAIAGLT